MKRKKAMAIVMVAAMTVTMLAGCGSSAFGYSSNTCG